MHIGIRPKVRNHYRAHKLSIWLRLIPLIHQEDKENTSPHHHAIFKYSNGTTLQNTTRKTISNFQENLHPSPTDRPLLPSQSSTLATHQPSEGKPSSTNNNEATEGHTISPTSDNSKNLTDRLKAEAIYHGSYSTALSVTIAVGCSLLILNILIFAGIYYQRDKNRLEAKLQKKNYKLKKVNEELGCQAAAMPPLPTTPKQTAGIVALPRAPPPSPVGQSSRVRGPPDFPSAAVVAQTLNTLKSPPKVPPKPSTTFVSNETNALTEAQPLLAQNATGNKLQSKNQKLQEIRV